LKIQTLKKKQIRINNDKCFSFFYLIPFLSIFAIFTLLPVIISLILSFTNFNGLEMPKFVFFDNYLELFLSDDEFLLALKNTLIIAIFAGPIGYFASLILAWFINELSPKIRAVMVLVFYAPSISGGAYMIWQLLFNSDAYGYVNAVLLRLNLITEPVQWFTDTRFMLPLVIAVTLWMSLGTGFLALVAGLQGVDKSLYEAGYVDGIRNRWQELWFITLPSLGPQLLFSAVTSISSAFSVGAVTTALCGFPSTDYAAHTLMNHLEDYGSIRFEMGYASTIATILFAMMLAIKALAQKIIKNVGQ
jgi:multiple sugar transport system permease protein